MISPFRIRRRAAAARAGAVNHIVVDQRCAVQQFDHRREADGAVVSAAGIPRGKKQKCGTQPLPAAAQQVRGNFRNRWERGIALAREFFFN
ncbi:MAG: hypothetical protein AUH86_11505 [Acidobacteria bacterium 13_1_40CM_4_58_4]|nr:MAG: hypothetical protein AUH86_11505 [Acidobacteria bacterium 13_1_40CM_4_58_4]